MIDELKEDIREAKKDEAEVRKLRTMVGSLQKNEKKLQDSLNIKREAEMEIEYAKKEKQLTTDVLNTQVIELKEEN
jgi:phage host-nuclease inhibitor protein Gam